MKVFITGANGFVGTHLVKSLLEKGHRVTGLVRSKAKSRGLPEEVSVVIGRSMQEGAWQEAVPGHDLLINLAGANIFKRWNAAYKQLLRDSRILTTRNLVQAIPESVGVTLLSTSAVGYYGFTGDEALDETSAAGSDFLATLAKDWEAEALAARDKGVRVVTHRFGIVFGKDGGAFPMMALPFRFFLGGPIGSGEQWLSWIHIEDLSRAILFVADHPEIEGPVNFTAPEPVRNREFASAMGKVLGRPSCMRTPGFMMEMILGEFGSVILRGQRVVPRVLEQNGFIFAYAGIESALRALSSG